VWRRDLGLELNEAKGTRARMPTVGSKWVMSVSMTVTNAQMVIGVRHRSPAISFINERMHAGYGQCSKCKCAAFVEDVSNRNVCSRCGNSYSEHW
jgi:hypothetical protein